jgi:hypothetical protein
VNGSDGTTYSSNVAVAIVAGTNGVAQLKDEMALYPNPATDIIKLKNTTATNYSMYDEAGRIVSAGKLNPANAVQQINIASLKEGVFTLKVTNNKQSNTYRFVKKQ